LQDDSSAEIGAHAARWDGIDVLRGLSIIFVVMHHTNLHMAFNHVSFASMLPKPLARILFWNGANGVTVFFAISGFLITTNALRRWGSLQRLQLASFYRMRVARIAPLLLALLVVLSCLHLAHAAEFTISPSKTSLPRALLAAMTFHINWLESAHGYLPANWDVLWSLSVEEMFYLFFPLLCLCSRGPRTLIAMLATFVVLGPFARTVFTKNELWADYGYLSCMDAIALGCLAAMAAPHLPSSKTMRRWLAVAGSALMLLVTAGMRTWNLRRICPPLYGWQMDNTALALGTSLLLIALSQRNTQGQWPSAAIRWFGRNSYEVYLTHMFVVTWGIQLFVAKGLSVVWAPAAYLTMLGMAGGLGAVVARCYSEPMNRRLRERWKLIQRESY
jgi:peptidoglycan/LPS O-acetylase OafA/YrhL